MTGPNALLVVLARSRQLVLGTQNPSSRIFDLNDGIRQVSCADMFEGRVEKFSLASGRDTGNKDDYSSMQWFLSVKLKKVGTIVGDKGIVSGADGGDQFPVFRPAKAEIIHMIGDVACGMRQFD